jgi:Kef-type K+ transport system membrane component KefB
MMLEPSAFLITLGGILLLGLATDALGKFTRLPRVTLLLLFGLLIGREGLNLLPSSQELWFTYTADMALVMVGFLLGQKFNRKEFQKYGLVVLQSSIIIVLITALMVSIGLIMVGMQPALALLLAGISTATAPAATLDVIHESKAKGEFTDILQGIVAIDDAWGIVLFSFILASVQVLFGPGDVLLVLKYGFWELFGAVGLGFALGVPMAYLSGRIKPGEPTLLEALGIVLLCGGLSLALNVSFLLSSIVLGATISNFARHHKRTFSAIEGIEHPFLILFFIFAGASLELESLLEVGLVGLIYIVLRVAGRLLGGWLSGKLTNLTEALTIWIGPALLPQAGVAMGMALIAVHTLPELREIILPVVIGSTIVFELFGPIFTKLALSKSGDLKTGKV